MGLPVEELGRCINDCRAFDQIRVTAMIESLSESHTRKLLEDRRLLERLRSDIVRLQQQLESWFVGRQELIEISLACFIAHLPMVALGPPGTAKSSVFRAISHGLGLQERSLSAGELAEQAELVAESIRENVHEPSTGSPLNEPRRYFEYLVTRFTTPEEILGPAHLSLMIHRAVFYRQTQGLLPEAEVAFLDEVFKANSAILNALLSIMNERLFYNAGRPTRVPLCMVFGASNEPPEEKELIALYDRFPVRVPCLPIDDTPENARSLLNKSISLACESLFARDGQGPKDDGGMQQVATVNHFRLLHRLLYVKYGGRMEGDDKDPFSKAYYDTFRSLRREFAISDRSYFRLHMLARALAVLRGKNRLEPSELDVFKYCFNNMEAAPALRDVVDERIRRYKSTWK